MKGNKAEIIRLIKKAIDRNNSFIGSCEIDTNPQVVSLVQKNRGEKAAYENVLNALTGKDLIALNIAAGF